MLVSVIIPTRNRADLLGDVLDALEAQTLDLRRFEVIVLDNRSTDHTARVIADRQARGRLTLRYQVMPTNQGPTASRNCGARLALGDYLAFTDDDCRPTPAWLEKALSGFAENVAFVTGPVTYKPEQGPARFFARDNHETLDEHPTYGCSNIVYRRDIFMRFGGMDETLSLRDLLHRPVECSDTDLAWRVKDGGYRNVFVRDALVYHELQHMRPFHWICEPLRLFVVAALIRRHPLLRRRLLYGRLFFVKSNLLFYLAVLGVALSIWGHVAWLALALPYIGWGLRIVNPSLSIVVVPKVAAQLACLAMRHLAFTLALLYGSIRYRTVVL